MLSSECDYLLKEMFKALMVSFDVEVSPNQILMYFGDNIYYG